MVKSPPNFSPIGQQMAEMLQLLKGIHAMRQPKLKERGLYICMVRDERVSAYSLDREALNSTLDVWDGGSRFKARSQRGGFVRPIDRSN